LASIDPEQTPETVEAGAFGELFEADGLGHVLIGGQAVNIWLSPRVTGDYDFTVTADRAAIEKVEADLRARGFDYIRRDDALEPSGPDFIRMTDGKKVIVDLQPAKTDYQELVIERAVPLFGGTVRLATPEDLIVLKLIANRSKDQYDLSRLVSIPGIDWEYVEHWCRIWDVAAKLAALRAAFPPPDSQSPG
jgi:hypothetical protein